MDDVIITKNSHFHTVLFFWTDIIAGRAQKRYGSCRVVMFPTRNKKTHPHVDIDERGVEKIF